MFVHYFLDCDMWTVSPAQQPLSSPLFLKLDVNFPTGNWPSTLKPTHRLSGSHSLGFYTGVLQSINHDNCINVLMLKILNCHHNVISGWVMAAFHQLSQAAVVEKSCNWSK